MKTLAVACLTFGCLAASPSAAAEGDPSLCRAISNDLDRLACYDKGYGRTPTTSPLGRSGKWQVEKQTSAMTDKVAVFLAITSEETVDCGWNRGDKITLILRCLDGVTSLLVSTGCHMTSSDYNDYGDVTYRIDDTAAATAPMEASTNNRSLGLWSGGKSIPFIKKMIGKSKLLVKATPYGENPFTATFDIAGLDQAIPPLRQACSW